MTDNARKQPPAKEEISAIPQNFETVKTELPPPDDLDTPLPSPSQGVILLGNKQAQSLHDQFIATMVRLGYPEPNEIPFDPKDPACGMALQTRYLEAAVYAVECGYICQGVSALYCFRRGEYLERVRLTYLGKEGGPKLWEDFKIDHRLEKSLVSRDTTIAKVFADAPERLKGRSVTSVHQEILEQRRKDKEADPKHQEKSQQKAKERAMRKTQPPDETQLGVYKPDGPDDPETLPKETAAEANAPVPPELASFLSTCICRAKFVAGKGKEPHRYRVSLSKPKNKGTSALIWWFKDTPEEANALVNQINAWLESISA